MLRPPDADLLYAAEWKRSVTPCRICRGTGKLIVIDPDDDLNRRIERCACLRRVVLRCRMAEGNVPEEFWGVEDFQIERNLERFATVRAYCDDLAGARTRGRGFVLCGENGAGKTSAACLILARAIREGFTVGYLTTQEYLSTIIPAGHDEDLAEWFRAVQTADFLVLDELGKEHRKEAADGSAFWLASLDSLIRQRCQNLRPTVLVSNFSAAQVQRVYGESFMSVLSHRVEYLTFEPGDFRREQARRLRKERGRSAAALAEGES